MSGSERFSQACPYDYLVTDFNKHIIMIFDALFGTSACHFGALHFFLCAFG